jgi:uncharacterized membrane protein
MSGIRVPPDSFPARLLRFFVARPRLFGSALVGILAAVLAPPAPALHGATRLIVGWNAGACLYLLLAWHMIVRSTHERMRSRAAREDEGRIVILAMVVVAALFCLGAILVELAVAKEHQGPQRFAHMALAGFTIFSSWAFTQVMFALHYAHDYYIAEMRNGHGGLVFPGSQAPDYWDFLYFSVVIGTSAQTADVSLASRPMRRTGLVHCVLAFFFNTMLIALTINIASGLV